jgi:hypothetical protein
VEVVLIIRSGFEMDSVVGGRRAVETKHRSARS